MVEAEVVQLMHTLLEEIMEQEQEPELMQTQQVVELMVVAEEEIK